MHQLSAGQASDGEVSDSDRDGKHDSDGGSDDNVPKSGDGEDPSDDDFPWKSRQPDTTALLGLGRLRRSLNKDVFNEEAGGWIESEAAAAEAAAVEAERARTPEERAEKWRESSQLANAALNGAMIKQQLNDMSQFVKFKSAAHYLRKGGMGASFLLGLSALRDADRRGLAKQLSRQTGSKRRSREASESESGSESDSSDNDSGSEEDSRRRRKSGRSHNKRRRARSPFRGTCNNCGRRGHRAWECRAPQGERFAAQRRDAAPGPRRRQQEAAAGQPQA
ncbi:hypothetical protein GPECTOR_1985g1013 [Gonium pectorale]|uniref:CCHC-type domain-containing protein n=1 Tax=Gonium pectorale TaxID=33097 RepID=A0A150FTA6_GONPE|nr:hypothetical protein GPECTOR_1985g1013 [Gonium pectorale]|eukprot:KXZ40839.1 hypothetical protein GPECTOR_1985g1013 [Gonium pectorale]